MPLARTMKLHNARHEPFKLVKPLLGSESQVFNQKCAINVFLVGEYSGMAKHSG